MAWITHLLAFHLLSLAASQSPNSCRCYPNDPCWPSVSEWAAFNASIAGNLIATSPIGSVCHADTSFVLYNSQACADLQASWNIPSTHYETSSSPMEPWFTNFSCSPFTEPTTPCTIDPLIHYAVKVTSVADVQRTLEFANKHSIRLVIRNTGHDYLGNSTGAGSLALWTHHYKPSEYIPSYNSSGYTGPALRIGAGVQGFDALHASHAFGLTLVTGNCPTVGLAGGYTQGGGAGQLSIVTVSPAQHEDLFWALGGGGAGSSVNGPFWMVVKTFLVDTLPLLDAGGVSVWSVLRAPGTDDLTFAVAPVALPGGTLEQLTSYMASTLDALQEYNISYSYLIKGFPTFYDSYSYTTPVVNVSEVHLGGRLIPRSTIDAKPNALIEGLHSVAQQGAAISGLALNVSHAPSTPNAVNPAWRETGMSIIIGLPVDHNDRQVNLDRQQQVTRVLVPELAALASADHNGDSAYLNEADFNEPDWQSVFYGANYDRLQRIKDKYDADQLFYA
ncbi:hypothetical protein BJX99DRAFT_266232 [Aspergillus californicus]